MQARTALAFTCVLTLAWAAAPATTARSQTQRPGQTGKARRGTTAVGAGAGGDVVVKFQGQVDGTDRITIDANQATWEHVHWDMPPEPVKLNGVTWDPRENPTLKNQGETRFLPRAVDFSTAKLRRISGRDTVALETRKDAVVVHVSDTPFEAAPYEFEVVFRPKSARPEAKARARSPHATLKIAADIDGSDELHIDAKGARWVHHEWDWPTEVRLNDVVWKPEETPTLANTGATRFLDPAVDFATARVTKKEGRDTAVLEHTDGGVVIYFADSLLDRSPYEVVITFGE